VLAVVFILKEPLPFRFVGVIFETVSHEWLLVGVFHVILDVTFIVVLPPAAGEFHVLDGDTVRMTGAAWFIVTVRVIPPPDTVTVPDREVVPVFAGALILNEPLFEPLVGVTVNQV